MKSKIIEIPEAGIKITVEFPDPPDVQLSLPIHVSSLSLPAIAREVIEKVIGSGNVHLQLWQRNNHQWFADARHVFCFAAHVKYGKSKQAIAEYLERGEDTVAHSIREVRLANANTKTSLWAAYKRYES